MTAPPRFDLALMYVCIGARCWVLHVFIELKRFCDFTEPKSRPTSKRSIWSVATRYLGMTDQQQKVCLIMFQT